MALPLDHTAHELLRRLTGRDDAEFRPGQLEAIRAVVGDRGRALVVQRTGWGKSAVYFIATRLLRDHGAGATLLVSPLLALMRNQLEMAERAGVRAATINSTNRDDWEAIEADVRAGSVDLLLISPERLNNPRFRADVLPHLAAGVGMLVVDEAHCISDWGHDFRPDYRRVAQVIDSLPDGVPVLCTTATANQRVVDDVAVQVDDPAGAGLAVFRGPLGRESLSLAVVRLPDPAARLAWLAREIPRLPGSGIVYCLTVADCERVAGWLAKCGIDALAYSGGVDDAERLRIEGLLATNQVKAVVATSALGMGYDKPDLGFVVHYQSPGSPIAYYQQVGRAGRALADAHGILLVGTEDTDIQDYFIRVAFPPRPLAETVVGLLDQAGGPVKVDDLLREVNIGKSRLEAMLKVLDVEGAVERISAAVYTRTNEPWAYDEARVERVTAARRAEQAAMAEYAETGACLMAFLRRALDDPEGPGVSPEVDGPADCGRCANCTGTSAWAAPLDPEAVAGAGAYLRSAVLAIEARKQWMGAVPDLPYTIPAAQRTEEGRALSVYGDGGWGSVVRAYRQTGRTFPDDLVDAAVNRIRGWSPQPRPAWVTCVPSARAPSQMPTFARRLADALRLPFVDAVIRIRSSAPQAEMENSAQQLRNVHGAFAAHGDVPTGAVLLVDDVHDSRWTITVVGALLRSAGAGPVHPFTLAQATSE